MQAALPKPYRVLILGAGVAGSAAALALAKRGIGPVLMVDKGLPRPFAIGEGATPEVPRLLAQLGVNAHMQAAGHRQHHATLSSWGGNAHYNDFLFKGGGVGWHLDRSRFNQTLRQTAQERIAAADGTVLQDCWIRQVKRDQSGWLVDLGPDHGTVRADCLVDAGGRASPLARKLGAKRIRFDRQVALAVVSPNTPTSLAGLSLVEAEELGWWYAAPLPQGGTMVALMTDYDLAQDAGLLDRECFLRRWQQSPTLQDHGIVPPDLPMPPHVFAAHAGCCSRAAGPGWIAVGDALIGYDPLTSSGIAAALSDADAAAAVVDNQDQRQAADVYAQRANRAVERFLTERHQLWMAETRWPQSPYWQRRHRSVKFSN